MQDKTSSEAQLFGERVLPSSDRLLRGVQSTLQKIAGIVSDEQSKAELSIIDAVLSELARRNDTAWYANFYRDMRALLVEGRKVLGAHADASLLATIDSDLGEVLPATLAAELSYDTLARRISRVMRHLAALVNATPANQAGATLDFLQRVVAKEDEFHQHRSQIARSRQYKPAGKAPVTKDKLEAYLREREPNRKGLRVTNFKQLVGGFQKVTILFETEDDSGRRDSLVLRMEKDDKFVALDASDIRREYEIVKFVHAAGVPVAEPYWLEEDEAKLGNRFFVSQRVPGQNLGSAVSSSGFTEETIRSYMEGAAKLHGVPLGEPARKLAIGHWLDYKTSRDNTRAAVQAWRHQKLMHQSGPSPITERVTRWLMDNAPDGDIPQCLIHCDYGPHNTLVHEGKLSGILDWESARIGDPAEDISWLLYSSGGSIDTQMALDMYEEITGHRISLYRLRYYDVVGCLKIMVSHGSTEAMYESHEEASIVWLNLSMRFTPFGTSTLEQRIRIAEEARGR